MFRSVSRTVLLSAARPAVLTPARIAGRRFLTTNPPHLQSRSWKSSALRWGIAFAGIYYYNTSPVFAEHPESNLLNPNTDALEDDNEESLLDTLTASSRNKARKDASALQSTLEAASKDDAMNSTTSQLTDLPMAEGSPSDLEEEADQQGAFNPITGEINWDCPCLGGMAHGPCGPQFRDAFSCFVYSTEEPKGMNCIDKFQNMQNCFREHPEHYKAELEDDELDAELVQEKEDLTNQIAQRNAADKENEKKVSPQSASGSSNKSRSKKESSETPKKASKAAASEKESSLPSAAKISPSSEPHPGMSEDHEAKNEGQSSQIIRKPSPPSIDAASTTEDQELVPRAAHSALNTLETEK